MKKNRLLASIATILTTASLPLSAVTLEDWQFNETAGTQLAALVNDAGSATWANDADVTTDGIGNLVFVQGTGTDPDNVFRNSTLTTKDLTTGTYELRYTISAATLAGGGASGANVGFGVRDDSNTDLFLVRLQRNNSALRLEYRNGATTVLEDFGTTTIADLQVRAVVNLDTDTCDVYWRFGTENEACTTALPLAATGLEADMLRMAANTNITDWGAADVVKIDSLTFSDYTAPAPLPLIGDWQFNDAAGASFDTVANAAGSANLGAAVANVVTNGTGQLVYTVGASDTDNVFRTSEITDLDQSTGTFEIEWLVTSADLSGGDATGANIGFGFRDLGDDNATGGIDTAADTDLFTVRLQKQNGTLRLQHRIGNTNTDLINFGVTSLSNLLIKVIADMDADTFTVFWQLNGGIGQCVANIPMAGSGLDFDVFRTSANTNNVDWGASDTVLVDYLTVRGVAVDGELSLSIAAGPGANEMTLIWPTSTPATAVLESSINLMNPWTEITDTPTVNGENNELIISTIGVPKNFFRLRNP